MLEYIHSCNGTFDCRRQLYQASLGKKRKIFKRNLGTIAKFIVTVRVTTTNLESDGH